MRDQRRRAVTASIASSLLILAAGLVPTTNAADHLDAPGVANNGAADITDLYAFSTANSKKTVLILNVNPGAGVLAQSGTTFGSGIQYKIKVDTNGDTNPDVTYTYRFGAANHNGVQNMKLYRNGTLVSNGWTGQDNSVSGGGKTTAGLFDDPFFFDLDAFKGAVLGSGNGRTFCDSNTTDFFAGLNVSSIILKVPNGEIGGNNANIGVWATTEVLRKGAWVQADQMGRPAINTVFNNVDSAHKTDRDAFNRTAPVEQPRIYGQHVQDVLTALGAADPAGLAGVLLPDILTYKTGDTSGFLNGRRLSDDVIDAELNLVTNGGITTDCVDNDSAFSSNWPYLAAANN
jgi:hypothetical protein